jgi:hypothetical protein
MPRPPDNGFFTPVGGPLILDLRALRQRTASIVRLPEWPPSAGDPLVEAFRPSRRDRTERSEGGDFEARYIAFRDALGRLGWTEPRNLRVDFRSNIRADLVEPYAKEIVSLAPDVIFVEPGPVAEALQRLTRTPTTRTATRRRASMSLAS